MKVSQLMQKLQKVLDTKGDIDVVVGIDADRNQETLYHDFRVALISCEPETYNGLEMDGDLCELFAGDLYDDEEEI